MLPMLQRSQNKEMQLRQRAVRKKAQELRLLPAMEEYRNLQSSLQP